MKTNKSTQWYQTTGENATVSTTRDWQLFASAVYAQESY